MIIGRRGPVTGPYRLQLFIGRTVQWAVQPVELHEPRSSFGIAWYGVFQPTVF